tara:strand:- start:375 stop:920 length:546 start_codon:yes stop_codon:yes gene_type:complete
MISERELIDAWNNIYGKNENSVDIIQKILMKLEKYEDTIFAHPFCHESAHQALTNIKIMNKESEYIKSHDRRVKIFMMIWENALKLNILNDNNYRDKYGFTAIQRLMADIPRKLISKDKQYYFYEINYDVIDPEINKWIKNNLISKYKLDFKKKNINFRMSRENEEIYSADYYGEFTTNDK